MSRRRRVGIAAAAVAMLAASFGGTVSRASDSGAGCPNGDQTFTQSLRSCGFSMKGFPVTFHGSVLEATGSSNSIRVWITASGYPQVVLAECRRSGTALPSCSGGIPDSTTVLDLFGQNAERPKLVCNVQMTGTKGSYFCHSGSRQT